MGCAVRLTRKKWNMSRLVVSPWLLVTLFSTGLWNSSFQSLGEMSCEVGSRFDREWILDLPSDIGRLSR